MKYAFTLTALFLLSACDQKVDDYCHTPRPTSNVDLYDKTCDGGNDRATISLAPKSSPRTEPKPDTPSVPNQPVTPDTPDVPDTPDNPDVPDQPDNPGGPNHPPKDKPKGNNGHGNGNDDGTCRGRDCTDDTNPGNGPKNK